MNKPTHKRLLSPIERDNSSDLPSNKVARGAELESTAESNNTLESNECDMEDANMDAQELLSHVRRFTLTSNISPSQHLRISPSLRSAPHHTTHLDFHKFVVLQVVQSVVEPHPLTSYRIANNDALWKQERSAPRTSLGIFECNVADLMASNPAMLFSLLETEKRRVTELDFTSLSINDFVPCLKLMVSRVERLMIHIRQRCGESISRYLFAPSDSPVKSYFNLPIDACQTALEELSTMAAHVYRDVIFDFFRSFRSAGRGQGYNTLIYKAQHVYGLKAYRKAVNANMQGKVDMHNGSAQEMQPMTIGSSPLDERMRSASRFLVPHHIYLLYTAILDQLYWWWLRNYPVERHIERQQDDVVSS